MLNVEAEKAKRTFNDRVTTRVNLEQSLKGPPRKADVDLATAAASLANAANKLVAAANTPLASPQVVAPHAGAGGAAAGPGLPAEESSVLLFGQVKEDRKKGTVTVPKFRPVDPVMVPRTATPPAAGPPPAALAPPPAGNVLETLRPVTSRPATSNSYALSEQGPVTSGLSPREKFSSSALVHAHHEIYHVPNGQPRPSRASSEKPLFKEPPAKITAMDKWRTLMLPGSEEKTPEEIRAANYNRAVSMLKDKIYQKGPFAIQQYFQQLDADNSGVLEREEFLEAMALFNLGECMTEEIADMLLTQIDLDNSQTIDYREFTDALRMGQIKYIQQPGTRNRKGPDPENPFGTPSKVRLPYGTSLDADKNLEAFDGRITGMYSGMGKVFAKYDDKGNGKLDKPQFAGALKELSKSFGLNLSGDEIDRVFGEAGGRLDGNVQYKDFMVKLQKNTGSKRMIPEFLKPKTMRRSQSGHIWAWNPDGNLPHKWQS